MRIYYYPSEVKKPTKNVFQDNKHLIAIHVAGGSIIFVEQKGLLLIYLLNLHILFFHALTIGWSNMNELTPYRMLLDV